MLMFHSFFMLKKWPKDAPAATKHQIFHPYSAEGQDKKRERQKAKKKRSRQAKAKARYQEQMKARAAAKAASASASSEAAASLNQPLWLRPAPVAEETELGLPSGSEEDSHSLSSGLQEQAEVSGKRQGERPYYHQGPRASCGLWQRRGLNITLCDHFPSQ